MTREFTQAKKDEIENALASIDDREWKSFMEWCGGRAVGFGDWADRLGIFSYTRQIDNYQNRILELNDDVRRQVDIAFEGAAEADRGYAGIFRRHAETVREQIKTVQTMVQVMQSANRTGVDIKALVHGMRPQPESSRAERLESGRQVLKNYLKARGITDSIVQQEICDLITKEQPYMLENLYMADFCGSEDTGRAYDLIMECYTGYKTEKILMEYLEKYGVTDPAEQQEIYGMLLEKQPSMLQDLYRAVKQGSGDADEILCSIIDLYLSTKYREVDYIIQKIVEEDVSTYEEMFSLSTYDLLARMIYQEMRDPKNGEQSKVLWATINRFFSDKNFTYGKEKTLRNILKEGGYTSIKYNRNGVFNAYHPDYDSEGWENAKRLAAVLYSQVGESNADDLDEEKIREEISTYQDIYGYNIENTIGNCDSFHAGDGENIFYEYGKKGD